jgi:hypothetical protein
LFDPLAGQCQCTVRRDADEAVASEFEPGASNGLPVLALGGS